MVVMMVNTWNQFHLSKRVDSEIEELEFSKGCWSIDLRIKGVVESEFVLFLLPALVCQGCIWFLMDNDGRVTFHIQ